VSEGMGSIVDGFERGKKGRERVETVEGRREGEAVDEELSSRECGMSARSKACECYPVLLPESDCPRTVRVGGRRTYGDSTLLVTSIALTYPDSTSSARK
jgi:hypothetical protein